MNLFDIGKVIDGVGKIADDLHTSKEEKLEIALQERAMDVSLMQGQKETNNAEAQHKSVFVAGWRPFIGWVGGLALAYQFLLYPLLIWLWAILQAYEVIPCHLPDVLKTTADTIDLTKCTFTTPPNFDAGPLFAIVTGMLGIGGMRSFDKLNKIDTKRIGK